jgi:acyl dehydratase
MILQGKTFRFVSPRITADMTRCYGEVNNDTNAIHYDAAAALAAGFPAPVMHGAISAAIVHQALRRAFGAVWTNRGKLELRFLKPVPIDSILTVEIDRVARQGRYVVTARVSCVTDGAIEVVTGTAAVRLDASAELLPPAS